MGSLVVWLVFLAAAGAIFYAGCQLSRCGDVIAEKTNVSRGWIGFILLALITSLPEVATSLSAASLIKSPDLALGNIFGSNIFNLLIIVLLDLIYSPAPLLSVVSKEHSLSASLGILLTSLAILGLTTRISAGFWGISLIAWGILFAYLIGTRLLFKHFRQDVVSDVVSNEAKYTDSSLGYIWLKFAFFSAIIIGGGVIASYSGRSIAQITGLSHTLVGTFMLAVITSLPEVAVSVGALRLGEVDMAMGNLLGSNVLNLSLIFLVDVVYRQGGIFTSTSAGHIFTATEFLILSSIVLISLSHKAPRKQLLRLGVDSWCILGVYLLGLLVLVVN